MSDSLLVSATVTPDESASSRVLWRGVLNRLLLPVLTILLVFWNCYILLVSWVLLPCNDFGRMYASTDLFVHGRDMYAWTKAATSNLEEDYSIDLHNMNPPHLHLLLLPLTLVPEIDHAFILWWVLSVWCLYYCLRWTLAELRLEPTPEQRRLVVLALLAFSGTGAMLFTGQLCFLLLVPLTLSWRSARRGQWGWSGVHLGVAFSVKPFLGVLFAYYCWRRRWRAASLCLLSCLLCYAVGLLVFGWANHVSWRNRLAIAEGWAWLPMNAGLMGMLTRTFTESVWYVPLVALPTAAAWLLWVVVGGVIGLFTLWATGRGDNPAEVDQDYALLLVASVLLCPLGWIYYLWLALPPLIALLARVGQEAAGRQPSGQPEPEGSRPAASTGQGEAAGRQPSGEPEPEGWRPAASSQKRAAWPRWMVAILLITACWPVIGTRLFQPDYIGVRRRPSMPPLGQGWLVHPAALATATVGSIYFWGLFALWFGLVRSHCARRAEHRAAVLPPLDPADYRVSVLTPVFSETETVRQIVAWLHQELGPRLEEIIIVQSPRSSEASRTVCRELVVEYPQVRLHVQQQNPGLGRAVREGFELAHGNVVLMIDSDGEMEIDTVPRLLAEMERGGHGLVAASRWLPGGGFSGYSGPKYYLNWGFQQVFRWLFWTRLTDLTYGFKLLRAELVKGIAWEGTLHEIACETTLKPIRLGVSVGEVPSKWTARTQGVSKNTFWRNFRYVRLAWSILTVGVTLRTQGPPEQRVASRRRSCCACDSSSPGAGQETRRGRLACGRRLRTDANPTSRKGD